MTAAAVFAGTARNRPKMNPGESKSAGRIGLARERIEPLGRLRVTWRAISHAILTKPEAGMVFLFAFGDSQLRPLVVAAVVLVGVVEAA